MWAIAATMSAAHNRPRGARPTDRVVVDGDGVKGGAGGSELRLCHVERPLLLKRAHPTRNHSAVPPSELVQISLKVGCHLNVH
jgi:hypothetical protein